MDHLAGNTGNMCQGGKGLFVGREDIPIDSNSGEECEPIIVFESLGLSVCQ